MPRHTAQVTVAKTLVVLCLVGTSFAIIWNLYKTAYFLDKQATFDKALDNFIDDITNIFGHKRSEIEKLDRIDVKAKIIHSIFLVTWAITGVGALLGVLGSRGGVLLVFGVVTLATWVTRLALVYAKNSNTSLWNNDMLIVGDYYVCHKDTEYALMALYPVTGFSALLTWFWMK